MRTFAHRLLMLTLIFFAWSKLGLGQAQAFIQYPSQSPFLKRLGTFQVSEIQSYLARYPLRDVGQIIAVQTPAVEAVHGRAWSELDPGLTRRLGVNLGSLVRPGKSSPFYPAIGVAYFPSSTLSDLHAGMQIEVARYGLRKFQKSAKIIRLIAEGPKNGAVIFEIEDGQDWVPGASCELEIRSVKRRPWRVPSSSLIHIGTEEYVVRSVDSRTFEPKHVSVLEEDGDWVMVDGQIQAGDRIIDQGAILLKPEVQKLIKTGIH